MLVDPTGATQADNKLPVYSATIEESGPIRAVVKLTALSNLTCTSYQNEPDCAFPKRHCNDASLQVQHGYAIRIYAYAGKTFVKIDYQLQNSPYSDLVYGYPLYFDQVTKKIFFITKIIFIDASRFPR